jgi:hypothetical protein|tara:strand:- start:381 stop:725 length:345 start_codon:yes stop_codon:yes gene_type:complete
MNLNTFLDRKLAEKMENMRKISGRHPLKDYAEGVVRHAGWKHADMDEVWSYFTPNKRLKSTALQLNKEKMILEYNPYNIDQLLEQAQQVGQVRIKLYELIWNSIYRIMGDKVYG